MSGDDRKTRDEWRKRRQAAREKRRRRRDEERQKWRDRYQADREEWRAKYDRQREEWRTYRKAERRERKRRHKEKHAAWERWSERMFPMGLAARIIVLVLAVVLVVELLGWIFGDDETKGRLTEYVLGRQIINATELLDKTPVDDRAEVLAAVSGLNLQVGLSSAPPSSVGPLRPPDKEGRKALAELQRSLEPRNQFYGFTLASGGMALIAVQLADGQWVTYSVPVSTFDSDQGHGWFRTVATWGFVFFLIFWAAKRVSRPVRQFADAADRLGRDMNAPPLKLRGSREIRQAARAFNQMQMRVQRMVEDRTLMLAAISHDLKTVLTRLRLRAEFIEDPEQLAKAEADIEEMQAMLETSLAFAKGETEAEARVPTDLAGMLKSVLETEGEARGLEGSYTGPDSFTYTCGPSELRRTFANLIANAYTYGGSAEVTLASGEGEAVVTVSDRGPGIPDEMLEQVFQPFYRVEGSRNRATGGSGLGLAIARTIVRRHGGEIELSPREGGGLTATVALPL